MIEKWKCKYCNKWITTRDNGNVQFHDQEESKLNIIINADSVGLRLIHDKTMKSLLNKSKPVATKSKWNSNKYIVTGACGIGTMMPI